MHEIRSGSIGKNFFQYVGAQNASTGYDYTVYYLTVIAQKIEQVFRFEATRMQNLKFIKSDFKNEIQVVLEERRANIDDNPRKLMLERFFNLANLESSYQHPVIGYVEDISSLSIHNVKQWYKTWYVPNNAIVVVVGDVEANQMYSLARKHFGSLKSRKLPILPIKKTLPSLGERTILIKHHLSSPQFIMGYNTPVINTVEKKWEPYALLVLSELLAGNRNARLRQKLIVEKQLAVELDFLYSPFDKLNNVLTFLVTLNIGKKIDVLKKCIQQEINKLKTQLISSSELDRIKTSMIAANTYQKDSILQQGLEIGHFAAVGLRQSELNNVEHEIQKLTPQQIKEVAKKYLCEERLTMAFLES